MNATWLISWSCHSSDDLHSSEMLKALTIESRPLDFSPLQAGKVMAFGRYFLSCALAGVALGESMLEYAQLVCPGGLGSLAALLRRLP